MGNPSNLLKNLLKRIEEQGISSLDSKNIIAFSGGVDSSVVAAAVFQIYPSNSICVLGKSSSLPNHQLKLAHNIAKYIGIPIREVITKEGEAKEYIENIGMSCYSCKTHLYSSLQQTYEAIYEETHSISFLSNDSGISNLIKNKNKSKLVIYNGTNKDDLKDKTRVGLRAASEYEVVSPIDNLTKDQVRLIAKELGLPNYNYAASPCLRSRLAYGVEATSSNMNRVELAENMVRNILQLDVHHNMRVRHLKDNNARIEVDQDILQSKQSDLVVAAEQISRLGFSRVDITTFRSGSVSI